ncbi:MAG: MFS transporter [Chloroflexi bacterium]|nr:MAG: MFS transporter [Chloroflexota bacterium]
MITNVEAQPSAEIEKRPSRLFNKNFFLLWQGQTASQLGNQAFSIALALWIKQATGSATLMGLILMVSSLPAVLLGPIGGTFADRFNRKRIIVISDLINGIAGLTLVGVMFMRPEATNLIIVWLLVVSIVMATVSTFFNPAISASIPDIVPEEKLSAANGLGQFSYQVSIFIGQGLGGTLFRILGAPFLFLIDSLSYLFSAFSETFITIPQKQPEKQKDWRDSLNQFKADTLSGFRYVWQTHGLRDLVLVAAMLNFFLVPILILLPFYVEDFLLVTEDWYGFLLAAYGLGSILGFLLAGMLPPSGILRSRLMILFLLLEPVGFILMGIFLNPWAALILATTGGLLSGFVMVNLTTLLQITTPGEIRGRVFGLLATISGALSPLAMGLSGVIADLTGQNIPLIYIACGVISIVIVVVISIRPAFRKFLAYEGVKQNDESEK